MIVPSMPLVAQNMVTEPEQFSRTVSQYGAPGYPTSENYYNNSESNSESGTLQYKDWELKMYHMQSAASSEQEYFMAARKVQDSYPYTSQETTAYPSYPNPDYTYPNQNLPYYTPEVQDGLYYSPEQLAAHQYYQQHAAGADIYYSPGRQHSDGDDYPGQYDGSNESLGYHNANSSGRPSPHQYDGSPLPPSPECRKYAPMYVQSPGAAVLQRTENAALLCAVCGDNAACQHYGVRTCEGCKGFFKRTVQKKAKYVCLADKKCPVDKRRRNRCQFCRFQKCLAVGMVKEVVRSDSLKGRRGRLPSKPKNPNENPPSPPLPLITTLVRAHVENATDIPQISFVGDFNDQKEVLHFYMEVLMQAVTLIKTWLGRVGAFSEISNDDKDKLAQKRCFHFFLLRYAQRMKVNVDMITLPNGNMYHRSQLTGLMGDILLGVSEFALDLQRSDIDLQSFACMLLLTVLNERKGVKSPEKVESAESKVVDSLRDHCTYNPEVQNNPHLFSRAMGLLPALDNLGTQLISHIQKSIFDSNITVPQQLSHLFQTKPASLNVKL